MFQNRISAGRDLGILMKEKNIDFSKSIIIALPRGGVPVGFEISKILNIPMDIFCVKKIGHPSNPEYALGAVAEDGECYFNISRQQFSKDEISKLLDKFHQAAKDQAKQLRGPKSTLDINGKNIILVDDGIATGATMEAAVKLLKNKGANEITIATPVASPSTIRKLEKQVDRVITLESPQVFWAVGEFYKDFTQVSNQDVIDLLAGTPKQKYHLNRTMQVLISQGDLTLKGTIRLAENPKAWVVFAHGSGSSHLSPRNNWMAEQLYQEGFCSLLFDLLTEEEDNNYMNRFNITLMSKRLIISTQWLINSEFYKHTGPLPIAYFGASTGAGSALLAASKLSHTIPLYFVVSRGGRPDLADDEVLNSLKLPVLLIVGEEDPQVIKLNELAAKHLDFSEIQIVPGATHLFTEPGAMEQVAELTIEGLKKYLVFDHKLYPSNDQQVHL